MNPLKEAAFAIHEAETANPGLQMRMDVSHKFVHLTADLGERQVSRSVAWADIERDHINTLTATVALLVNQITAD
jgi:hypothetical protein